ncbi:MAG: DNA recombination protein RmuC [Alphaproteobacteria bacterium]|nr:DNA recombination protein RmuC [Alphaproteobacteria bacterium]PHY01154.1 MAG: DNA recombination protein RmuC [Rhodospirillaceae bacterium]
MNRLVDSQASMTGRLAQMSESQIAAQSSAAERLQAQERNVTKMLDERLTEVTRRVGENLMKAGEKTTETLGQLQERLAVIDSAQKNIAELSQDVVSLQDLLSNKQARGAIGQVQMEDLVRNMLPPGAFEFQFTLSNGKRADCVIKLPNPPGLIAVDSKYPHEAYARMISASDDRERVAAQQSFRTDVLKHIKDIAEKYIIPGETSDSAIMFVPAESVFAELHENFSDIVEAGFARRVYVVSPTTLMATLNTVRAILKDARMREQAHLIQREIGELTKDVVRLDKRVGELARHFGQAQTDVKEIQTSTEKIMKRGARIENIPLDASGEAVEVPDLIAPEAEQPRRELLQ